MRPCLLANATGVITFETLIPQSQPNEANPRLPVPTPYAGLGWANFNVLNGQTYACPSGFQAAVNSGKIVLYNGYGNPGWFFSFNGSDLTLSGFWATAAFKEGLTLTLRTYEVYPPDGTAKGSANFTLSSAAKTFIDLRSNTAVFGSIQAVAVFTSGGSGVPCGGGHGGEVVIDDIQLSFDGSVVPGPTTPFSDCPAAPTLNVTGAAAWPASCVGVNDSYICSTLCAPGFTGGAAAECKASSGWLLLTGSCQAGIGES
jgi:hypothetical protein